MAGRKLFTGSPVGTVSVVEAPVSQWYIRRARLTFLVGSFGTAALSWAVIAMFAPPLIAVALCIPIGMVCGFTAAVAVRVWPVLRALWWWFIELAITVPLLIGTSVLGRATRPWLPLLVLLLIGATCAAVGPVRRRLSAWSWCLVVRHRLRVCFARLVRGAGVGVRPGTLPLVLWARSTPAGERVWLWLRPGLELVDLDGKAGLIAVTCWANEVRFVRASTRYAALIRVDVARRDPLTGLVPSPLALLIPRQRKNAVVPVSPAVPSIGLDLADIPEPAPETPSRGGRR